MTPQFFPRSERWPVQASLLGGAHAPLIVKALNDPVLIVYMGWYVDSLSEGPVWHRWAHQLEKDPSGPRVGVAFLSALYGLACHGMVEFCGTGEEVPTLRVCSESAESGLLDGTLESELLDHVRRHGGCTIASLLEHVLPKKGWLRRDHPEDWLRKRGIELHGQDASPEHLVAALGLAALFVELEAGLGIEEPRRDRLEELLYAIEIATFRCLE
jgi:hypothetical protein